MFEQSTENPERLALELETDSVLPELASVDGEFERAKAVYACGEGLHTHLPSIKVSTRGRATE
jgi:hypothetical protein